MNQPGFALIMSRRYHKSTSDLGEWGAQAVEDAGTAISLEIHVIAIATRKLGPGAKSFYQNCLFLAELVRSTRAASYSDCRYFLE